jgi:hypothetical protein
VDNVYQVQNPKIDELRNEHKLAMVAINDE